jgi:hypothetical protein
MTHDCDQECEECGGKDPYRVPADPYLELKKRMTSLEKELQKRLDYRDEEFRSLERRVEIHFRADVILIILLIGIGMGIMRFWVGVGN